MKTKNLQFQVTKAVKKRIDKAAKEFGISTEDYLKKCVMDRVVLKQAAMPFL